jgi:hypothetical protein
MAKYGTFKYGDARYGTGASGPAFHLVAGGDFASSGQVGGVLLFEVGGSFVLHGEPGGVLVFEGGGDFVGFVGKAGREWTGYPGGDADTDPSLLVHLEPIGGGEALAFPAPADLRFEVDYPGGYKSMSCTLVIPAGTATPVSLAAYAHARVLDRRTGATIWYGQLSDPGLSASEGSQRYSLTAEGGQGLLDGWREVYGLVDRLSESWQPVGDFEAAQQSFSGDPFPTGDYNVDYPGFDFDPGTDVTFDPGDFTGADYPPSADYPGYLGWLQDPFNGVGASLPIPGMSGTPIPGSDTSEWPGEWAPGVTGPGGSAVITGGYGKLNSGTTAGGYTARRWAHPIWSRASGDYGWRYNPGAEYTFRLADSQATARIWAYADPTLAQSGHFLEVGASGTVTYRVMVDGVIYDDPGGFLTQSISIAVGTDYAVSVFPAVESPNPLQLEFRIWNPATETEADAIPFSGGGLVQFLQFGVRPGLNWPLLAPLVVPLTPADWDGLWQEPYSDRYFGVGVVGDGTTTSRAVELKSFRIREPRFISGAMDDLENAYLDSIGYTGDRHLLL